VDPAITILAGTARSEGVELEAQGRITDRWLVLGGYTYMNAAILSSPSGDRGSRLQNAPRHSLRAFSAYDLTGSLTIGAGIDYSSARVPGTVVDPNGFWQQSPGYWTQSVMARYTHYYDALDDNHVTVGAGRSAQFTLAVEN
jgi:catecholate siderophore receptor